MIYSIYIIFSYFCLLLFQNSVPKNCYPTDLKNKTVPDPGTKTIRIRNSVQRAGYSGWRAPRNSMSIYFILSTSEGEQVIAGIARFLGLQASSGIFQVLIWTIQIDFTIISPSFQNVFVVIVIMKKNVAFALIFFAVLKRDDCLSVYVPFELLIQVPVQLLLELEVN